MSSSTDASHIASWGMNRHPSITPYTSASLNMSRPLPSSMRLQHRHSTSSIGSAVSSNIGTGLSASTGLLSMSPSTKPLRSSPLAGPPALANTSSGFSDISTVDGALSSPSLSKENGNSKTNESAGNSKDVVNATISGNSGPKTKTKAKLSKPRPKSQPLKASKSKSQLPNRVSLSLRSHPQPNPNSNPNNANNSKSTNLSELGKLGSRERGWADNFKNTSDGVVVKKQERVVVMVVEEENEGEREERDRKSKAAEARPKLRKRLSATFLNFKSSSSSGASTPSNLIGSPQPLSSNIQNVQPVLGSSSMAAAAHNDMNGNPNSGRRKGHARRPSTAPSPTSASVLTSTIPEENESDEEATLAYISVSKEKTDDVDNIERPELGGTARREKRVRYSSSPVIVPCSSPSTASSSTGSSAWSLQTPPRQRPQSILRTDRDSGDRPQSHTSMYFPTTSPSRSAGSSRSPLSSPTTSPLSSPSRSPASEESTTSKMNPHRMSVPFPLRSSPLASSPPTSRRQSLASNGSPGTQSSANGSIKGKTTTTSADDSWYTFSQYATTPKFTRLGLAGAGVVMPVRKADMMERGRVVGSVGSIRGADESIRSVGATGGTVKGAGGRVGTVGRPTGEGTVESSSGAINGVDEYGKFRRLDAVGASSTCLPMAHRSATTIASTSTSSSSSSFFSRKFTFGFGIRSKKAKEKKKLMSTTTPSISDSMHSSLESSLSSKSSSLEISSTSPPSSSASSTMSIIPPSGALTPPSSVEGDCKFDELDAEMDGMETVKLSKPWKSLHALRSLRSLRSSE